MKVYRSSKSGHVYTGLNFPSRPTALPVHPSSGKIIARVGQAGQETVLEFESLEEIQAIYDLVQSGNLKNLIWGIIQPTQPTQAIP